MQDDVSCNATTPRCIQDSGPGLPTRAILCPFPPSSVLAYSPPLLFSLSASLVHQVVVSVILYSEQMAEMEVLGFVVIICGLIL